MGPLKKMEDEKAAFTETTGAHLTDRRMVES